MRIINMLAAVVAVACAIYVSYNHTVDLFVSFGYRGSTAHAGVIFVELKHVGSDRIAPILVEKVEPVEVVVNERSDEEDQPIDTKEMSSDEQENEEMNSDSPLHVAKELYDLEGQPPTRKRVMEIAHTL